MIDPKLGDSNQTPAGEGGVIGGGAAYNPGHVPPNSGGEMPIGYGMGVLNTNKPGWKTTEALVPVAAGVLGSLVSFGVLTPDDQTAALAVIERAIGAGVALVGMVAYLWGRIRIKVEKIKEGGRG